MPARPHCLAADRYQACGGIVPGKCRGIEWRNGEAEGQGAITSSVVV
jgi:hypothetical protein